MTYVVPDIGPGAVDFTKHAIVLGFDTECYRFPMSGDDDPEEKPLTLNRITRLVCSTWAGRVVDRVPVPILRAQAAGRGIVRQGSKGWSALLDRPATAAMVAWAFDPANDALLVAHNAAFDAMSFLHEYRRDVVTVANIFRAFAEDRVVDTQIREKLLAIAEGWSDFDPVLRQKPPKFGLDSVVQRRLGLTVEGKKGDDVWRLRYHELDGVPVGSWPVAAVDYALMDAEYALYAALAQVDLGYNVRTAPNLPPYKLANGGIVDECRQVRASLALALQPAWGVRTDPDTVTTWEHEITEALAGATAGLSRIGVLRQAGGIYRSGAKKGKAVAKADFGTKDTGFLQELVEEDLRKQGIPVKRTPTGKVQVGAEALLQCATPELRAWGEAQHYEKYRSTYLIPAKIGMYGPMPYNYDVLKDTGRTSSYGTNCQNPPKKGRFRECVTARPGMVLCSTDFTAAELCGLGQIHLWKFGKSVYAEMAERGIDLHAPVAAELWGISLDEFLAIYADKSHPKYTEAKTVYRQCAKALNFGGWGGLGPRKFVTYALGLEPPVNLADIARKTGVYAELADIFARIARDGDTRTMRKLQRWELATEQDDGTWDVPVTPVTTDLYVACAYAERILNVLRREAVPEGGEYLDYIAESVKAAGGDDEDDSEDAKPSGFTFEQYVSGRQRARCNYTNGANTGFQGIVADGAKEALWRLAVACYVRPDIAVDILWHPRTYWREVTSREMLLAACEALYGVRPVLFIHDEVIAEGPLATAHLWAPAQALLMREGMRTFIRDVKVGADPALMYVWDKAAEPVYDSDGKLTVWTPRK